MYALVPLDPRTAMSFEALAPFEVRAVLRDLGGLPRVHAVGATLMGRPIGLGIAVRGWSEPGAFAGTAPESTSARLLCLTVARTYRRIGVGGSLLRALEQALAAEGVRSIACNFALQSSEAVVAVEGLFRACGWTAPEVTMLQCRAAHSILESPLMQEQRDLPPEYEIVDWVDLSAQDREEIALHRDQEGWHGPSLDPFHFEPDLEVMNSLALRYQERVVGWLITRRTSPLTMYYRCLFVRSDLAKLGRGLALLREAIDRHHQLVGARPGFGEWTTPVTLPAMVRFIRRHLVPYGTTVTEQRVTRKQLDGPDLPRAAPRRTPRREVSHLPMLSAAECETVLGELRSAHAQRTHRSDPLPFFSLGAVAQLDGLDGAQRYLSEAARINPILADRFGWVYERLRSVLAAALGAPVAERAQWALPGFHLHSRSRGSHLPLAPVHCDAGHRYVEGGCEYQERPISFSVCISEPDPGSGVRIWDLGFDESVGLDTEESSRLLESVPSSLFGHERGTMLLYSGDSYHQMTPLGDRDTPSDRTTMEGHAARIGGVWYLYG